MTNLTATYTKLRDGSWGLRINGEHANIASHHVTVRTKAGAVKDEVIARTLWAGNGITLASIAQAARHGHSHRSGRRYECSECGEYVTPGTRCWEDGHTH